MRVQNRGVIRTGPAVEQRNARLEVELEADELAELEAAYRPSGQELELAKNDGDLGELLAVILRGRLEGVLAQGRLRLRAERELEAGTVEAYGPDGGRIGHRGSLA